MTESTVINGTKLVTPNDSYKFFSDVFDDGAKQTNGRFATYEIDFLDSNFAGSASMFDDVDAADRWYQGMADAALERNIAIQYCLPSATDMLVSLRLPAVVQARASSDYAELDTLNVAQLGGSSLLMGAVSIAPSKDTLWTRSPQPPTYSDYIRDGTYTTNPHVQLDVTLAVLSLGPVGISDGLGQTDVELISMTYMSSIDGTLLRPSRPLSFVDSVYYNRTVAAGGHLPWNDVRSTHAAVPSEVNGKNFLQISHYVVVWRTTTPTTLAATDLFPLPRPDTKLAFRQITFPPRSSGPINLSSFTIAPLEEGGIVLPATGGDVSNFSAWAIYEPLPNGVYFLGETDKIVSASPQRFLFVRVSSTVGKSVICGVRGSPGQTLTLRALLPSSNIVGWEGTLPASGYIEAEF